MAQGSSSTTPDPTPSPAVEPPGDREFHIVVYGATGFVGRLIAGYLAAQAPAGVRIALAGRSAGKLDEVRAGIPGATEWPLIVADSSDEAAIRAMAARTRVVLTTVGPYLHHGLPLVQACAGQGTHYADLTGEVLFIRRSIDAYDRTARESGARIVHSCGFDSIPSDLGVFALHRAALLDSDGSLGDTRMAVVSARGGISGGTIASMLGQLDAIGADRSLARVVADPYALSPNRDLEPSPGDGGEAVLPGFDQELQSWVGPFVMASINTRVVRRSNALLDYAYSRDFRYQEAAATGGGPLGVAAAAALAAGTGVGYLALSNRFTRGAVRRVLPGPGSGPSEETQRSGRFTVKLASRRADGRVYRGTVAALGDPGYRATSLMIGECALALALDTDRLPDRAGVLTPAAGLGQAGIDRLVAAGMTIEAAREE